jgi:hypothetical protein
MNQEISHGYRNRGSLGQYHCSERSTLTNASDDRSKVVVKALLSLDLTAKTFGISHQVKAFLAQVCTKPANGAIPRLSILNFLTFSSNAS